MSIHGVRRPPSVRDLPRRTRKRTAPWKAWEVALHAPRRPLQPSRATRRHRRRRTPLAALAAEVAGRSVTVAIPLHRLDPRLVNAAGLAEIAAFAGLLIAPSGLALTVLALASTVFLGLHLADHRAVLALQDDGDATILSAGRDGRPVGVRTGSARPPALPDPAGLAASVRLEEVRWWIDRAAFPLLAEARAAATPPR